MSNLDHYCAWCGKKYTHFINYNGISNCCSRRCAEKLKAQRDQEWEATKQKMRDSGGFFSWIFKTILKIIKWVLIAIVVLIVLAAISGK